MRYIAEPVGSFFDRMKKDDKEEPIDVVMATLDSESFLKICLYSVYREIPVRKLLVCDGGSNDQTIEILKEFPRVEIFEKPEIRTGGKLVEFLFSLVETKWFAFVDSDLELSSGWYDNMVSHKTQFDVLESSRRILAYHLYREDKEKLIDDTRAMDFCHLIKKEATKNYACDDDFMLRHTDILFQQSVEKSGFSYGKIKTTHIHNETEGIVYKSDSEKNFTEVVWDIPKWKIIDKEKHRIFMEKNAKSVIKYLDPNFRLVKNDKGYEKIIGVLDEKWVKKENSEWLERYSRAKSSTMSMKRVGNKYLKRFKRP